MRNLPNSVNKKHFRNKKCSDLLMLVSQGYIDFGAFLRYIWVKITFYEATYYLINHTNGTLSNTKNQKNRREIWIMRSINISVFFMFFLSDFQRLLFCLLYSRNFFHNIFYKNTNFKKRRK